MNIHPESNEKDPTVIWRGAKISVVSLGCGQLTELSAAAISSIQKAQVIIGAKHHFDEISTIKNRAELVLLPSPFSQLQQQLELKQDKRICLLASGDALFYGIGSWLIRILGSKHLTFYANISSLQACFQEIGLAWQDVTVISLHGRPLSGIRRHLTHNASLAVLTDATSNPITIAQELVSQGFGDSKIWVCESMGSPDQRVKNWLAAKLAIGDSDFQALNICVIQLRGEQTALPSFPGIADHYFSTGASPGYGMISKREVRLAILSLMQPGVAEIAWDIGAGCGSVSVEWARWNNLGQIYAIECDAQRVSHIKQNSNQFGTEGNLFIVNGDAPDCCGELPDPDCIFIGGSKGLKDMLEFAWLRLKAGGKLVASAVTESSRMALDEFAESRAGFERVEIQVSKNLPNQSESRILKPVLLIKCIKPLI